MYIYFTLTAITIHIPKTDPNLKKWVGSAYELYVRIMICQIRCIEERLTDYRQSPDVNFRFSVIM